MVSRQGNAITMNIAYFYFMKNEPDRIPRVAPLHHQYWTQRKLKRYVGGPFADLSGGLITFEADGFEPARRVIEQDPFKLEEVLDKYWIKEWAASGKQDEPR